MSAPDPDRAASAARPAACAACGEPFATRYCGGCGERRPAPDDDRLGPFLREQWQEATSADGKLWETAKALFVPGKLTEEYFAGRRGRYVRPVRIFLVCNLIFFLALTAFGARSSFLGQANVQRQAEYYGAWADARLRAAASSENVDQEVYDAAFDRQSGTLASSLVGLMVPMLALVLAVALFWRRASGVRHLVFATHYLAFAMLGSTALGVMWIPMVLAVSAAGWIPKGHWLSYTLDPVVMLLLLVYLAFALRRAYALQRWWSVGATVVLIGIGINGVTHAYRFALFVVALWTTDVPSV